MGEEPFGSAGAAVGEGLSPEDKAQARAAYQALQRQVPLLYAVALANVVGLHVSTGGELLAVESPATVLVVLMGWRLFHWIRQKDADLSDSEISRELKKTLIYAVVIAGGFSVWAQALLTTNPQAALPIAFFASLAALGTAYALSSHPAAASVPLLLLAFPLAGRLLSSVESAQIGMAISLLLLIGLTARLLGVQNRTVQALVASRLKLRQENKRVQAAERKAQQLAETDTLTGTANRRAFLARLNRAAAEQQVSAVALVDLDGFKPINDAFGHATGDAVLQCVSERLEDRFSGEALVARMGGDEFAILWCGPEAQELAENSAGEICSLIELTMLIEHRPVRVFACCGVATSEAADWTSSGLLSQADMALYAAKAEGKGRFIFFSKELLERQRRRAAVESALASGAAENELTIVFQPILDVATGRVEAFEALARWKNDRLGDIGPAEFIPAAEQMDLIGRLTDKTLDLALDDATGWPEELCLSFNISALHLCEQGAAERLLDKIYKAGFDPRRFQAEVTETALLANFQLARDNITALRAAGVIIALDDFGAGHASISYLREMSFDVVKLDGSLMTDIATSQQSKKLLRGIIDLCRSLGVRCVAEHVETSEQLGILRELGCDLVQGYLIGRPKRLAERYEHRTLLSGRRAA